VCSVRVLAARAVGLEERRRCFAVLIQDRDGFGHPRLCVLPMRGPVAAAFEAIVVGLRRREMLEVCAIRGEKCLDEGGEEPHVQATYSLGNVYGECRSVESRS
jgi:hypothetical protein